MKPSTAFALVTLVNCVLCCESLFSQSGAIASWELNPNHLSDQEFLPTKGEWKAKASVTPEFLSDKKGQSALQFNHSKQWLTIHSDIPKENLPVKKWSATAWVAIDSSQPWGGIIGAFEDNGGFERGFLLGFRNNRFCVSVATDKNPKLSYLASNKEFRLGTWYHIAGVYNGKELLLYIDGDLVAKKENITGNILYAETHQFTLGSYTDENENHPMQGAIAKASIYGKALNKKEIAHMATIGKKTLPEIIDNAASRKKPLMETDELQEKVHNAIDKGVEFLLRTQYRDGSWKPRIGSYRNGMTSLCVLALMESGVPKNHPAIRNALRFLGETMPTKVYSAGLQLMAFEVAGNPELIPHMEAITYQLLDWESRTSPGLWGYPSGSPDLSNAQFAALGLWAAHKKGIKIPTKVWERLAETAVEQCMSGKEIIKDASSDRRIIEGFTYYARDTTYPPYGGMVAAGLGILALAEICHPKPPMKIKRLIQRGKERGLGWLGHYFRVDSVPGYAERLNYYLYGLERVGSLLNLKTFGNHDWYRKGAEFLVNDQGSKGSWSHDSEHHCATGFALLFLNRATSPISGRSEKKVSGAAQSQKKGPVKIRVTGKQTLTMWISSLNRPDRKNSQKKQFQPIKAKWLVDGKFIGEVNFADTEDSRLAFRYTLPAPGNYQLSTEVECADGIKIASNSFSITASRGADVFHKNALPNRGRNLLARARPTISYSSKDPGGRWEPDNVLDGLQCTGWLFEKSDKTPWISFHCTRSLKANQIILSPVDASIDEENRSDSLKRIRISINDKAWIKEISFPSDPLTELSINFEESLRVRNIRIEILQRKAGKIWVGQGGFSEIILR